MKNKLWSSIALCQSRSKYARKEQRREEKQSEENRGQQLQSSFALLEYFPKFIFYMLYTISKLRKSRIQCFKQWAIQSLNERVTAIASWSLQAEGRFLHGWEITLLLRNDFAAFLHSAVDFPLKFPDTLEAEHRKLKANFAALRNQPYAAKWFRSPLYASAKSRRPRFHLRNGP